LAITRSRHWSTRRLYTSNADARFQHLRQLMEDEWTPQLTSLLEIPRRDLPMIWDADFMLGAPGADGADSYVLGEINGRDRSPSCRSAEVEALTCPLWVKSGHLQCKSPCPLYP
jgi:Domain of unknown function (DUF6815)